MRLLRSIIPIILFISFTAGLTACGGGDGDTSDSTPPVTTASPVGGSYVSNQQVSLSCDDGSGSGCATTYYTTDGSDPTTSSNVYSGVITITTNITLKFFSVDNDGNTETIKTETYIIDMDAPNTSSSPVGGNYLTSQSVSLSCDDGGGSGCATTYYTTDGSDPNTSSSVYSGAINITSTTTLKFFSVDNIGNTEAIQSETYTIQLTISVEPLYPSNGTNWNDYVESDGTSRFVATDTACDRFYADPYSACIHGGEYRVVEVTGITSCTGLTAADVLDAFNWACDDSTGVVRMISTSLKDGKYLSDLIDWTGLSPQWLDNSITVHNGTVVIANSTNAVWWNNPIMEDNDGGSLATAGTIYVVTSDPNADYTLDANKIGMVIQPGVVLHGSSVTTGYGIIYASNAPQRKEYLWIEGAIDATGRWAGIQWRTVRSSVLRNVKIANADVHGITFESSANSNLLSEIHNANNTYGLFLSGGNWNILRRITSTNNDLVGIDIGSGSNNILIDSTVTNNYDTGASIGHQSEGNVVNNLTSVNSATGVSVGSAAENNTLQNIASVNNILGISIGVVSEYNLFSNVVTTDNVSTINLNIGISISDSNFNYFTGLLKMGNNSYKNCIVVGSTITDPGLLDGTCANQGNSDAVLTTGVSAASSFVDKVTLDDTINTSDTNGSAAYDSITDWTSFDNSYRGWGKDGDAFPNTTNTRSCSGGESCRIWDWSLANGDTGDHGSPASQDVLSLPNGDDAFTHTWKVFTDIVCNGISGAVWNAGESTCKSTFLRNAVEIINDGLGNENGLCESNETCQFSPNIGSYQGHGNLIPAGVFSDGAITGVTLFRYETNGY